MTPFQRFQQHVAKWKNCQDCTLCYQRSRICIARGSVPCDVLLIGEAPGDSEDSLGIPFVGPAGKLLDDIVNRSVRPPLRWAMTNLVCCYPREAKYAGTNEPDDEHIKACEPRLTEFVEICAPKLIIRVGDLAANWAHYPDIKTVNIQRPAYILRLPVIQQNMAAHKCVVTIAEATEGL